MFVYFICSCICALWITVVTHTQNAIVQFKFIAFEMVERMSDGYTVSMQHTIQPHRHTRTITYTTHRQRLKLNWPKNLVRSIGYMNHIRELNCSVLKLSMRFFIESSLIQCIFTMRSGQQSVCQANMHLKKYCK